MQAYVAPRHPIILHEIHAFLNLYPTENNALIL